MKARRPQQTSACTCWAADLIPGDPALEAAKKDLQECGKNDVLCPAAASWLAAGAGDLTLLKAAAAEYNALDAAGIRYLAAAGEDVFMKPSLLSSHSMDTYH